MPQISAYARKWASQSEVIYRDRDGDEQIYWPADFDTVRVEAMLAEAKSHGLLAHIRLI